MKNLLYWISGLLPARLIKGDDGEPYLERYFVAKLFGCDVYLHRFIASDPDRGLHNHPWIWAASFVLFGGYWEILFDPAVCADRGGVEGFLEHFINCNLRWRRRFSFCKFGSEHLHRVVLEPGQECWTLFIAGQRTPSNTWGFLVPLYRRSGCSLWSFEPYTNSPSEYWWKSAPRGRDIARAPI